MIFDSAINITPPSIFCLGLGLGFVRNSCQSFVCFVFVMI